MSTQERKGKSVWFPALSTHLPHDWLEPVQLINARARTHGCPPAVPQVPLGLSPHEGQMEVLGVNASEAVG